MMLEEYKTLIGYAREQYVIKRSKFIASVKPVTNEKEALVFLTDIRSEFRDASHNCYAYRIIDNGSLIQRFNDDGEPSGTAGIPILSVIEQKSLFNVIVVVTRYFGGILLGAAGLVKAYSYATALAIERAGDTKMTLAKKINMIIPYDTFSHVKKIIKLFNAYILHVEYGESIILDIEIKRSSVDDFIKVCTDLAHGKIQWHMIGNAYIPDLL